MRLVLKRYRDGRLRPRWYGVYELDGRSRVATLCRWKGTPPGSGSVKDSGDTLFEASRQRAGEELREALDADRSEADAAALKERVHQVRYGHRIRRYKLTDLEAEWSAFPRKRKPSPFYSETCRKILARFVAYVAEHEPKAKELGAVTARTVRAFMAEEEGRGIGARTWNVTLSMLRRMYRRLDPHAVAYREYLAGQPARSEDTIHREPFTHAQLEAIFKAAGSDELLRQLIVAAACTAMRRGDVCRLRWRSVDLEGGFVTVKTGKTGTTVDIPLMARFRSELVRLAPGSKPDDFIWPEAARLYAHAPDALDRRLRAILARVGFVRPPGKLAKEKKPRQELPALAPLEARLRAVDAIGSVEGWTEKRRAHTLKIVTGYLDGQTVGAAAAAAGISKGLASMRIGEVETMIGARIIRRPMGPESVAGMQIAPLIEGTPRMRRGSLKGWHSFRTTWITLALSSGIPMELVRRVTGHATVDVVLKHYFRPGREDLRRAVNAGMPDLLTAGAKSTKEQMLGLLDRSNPRTWKADIGRLRELVLAM